jgi:hypothetical protein
MIGRKEDVITASILLDWLAREIGRLCELEWRIIAPYSTENAKSWKNYKGSADGAAAGRRAGAGVSLTPPSRALKS